MLQSLIADKIKLGGILILLIMVSFLLFGNKNQLNETIDKKPLIESLIDTSLTDSGDNMSQLPISIKADSSIFLSENDIKFQKFEAEPNLEDQNLRRMRELENLLNQDSSRQNRQMIQKSINTLDIDNGRQDDSNQKQNSLVISEEGGLVEACILNDVTLQNQGYVKFRFLQDYEYQGVYFPLHFEFYAKANMNSGKIVFEVNRVKLDNKLFNLSFDVFDFYDAGDGITYQTTKKEQRKMQQRIARNQVQNQLLTQAGTTLETNLLANSPLPIGTTGIFSSLGFALRRNTGFINTAKIEIPSGYKVYLKLKD